MESQSEGVRGCTQGRGRVLNLQEEELGEVLECGKGVGMGKKGGALLVSDYLKVSVCLSVWIKGWLVVSLYLSVCFFFLFESQEDAEIDSLTLVFHNILYLSFKQEFIQSRQGSTFLSHSWRGDSRQIFVTFHWMSLDHVCESQEQRWNQSSQVMKSQRLTNCKNLGACTCVCICIGKILATWLGVSQSVHGHSSYYTPWQN